MFKKLLQGLFKKYETTHAHYKCLFCKADISAPMGQDAYCERCHISFTTSSELVGGDPIEWDDRLISYYPGMPRNLSH